MMTRCRHPSISNVQHFAKVGRISLGAKCKWGQWADIKGREKSVPTSSKLPAAQVNFSSRLDGAGSVWDRLLFQFGSGSG
jgi:hypothetical protein